MKRFAAVAVMSILACTTLWPFAPIVFATDKRMIVERKLFLDPDEAKALVIEENDKSRRLTIELGAEKSPITVYLIDSRDHNRVIVLAAEGKLVEQYIAAFKGIKEQVELSVTVPPKQSYTIILCGSTQKQTSVSVVIRER